MLMGLADDVLLAINERGHLVQTIDTACAFASGYFQNVLAEWTHFQK